MTSVKSARHDSRIPELDGLRVLLVFIVSWYHIWQQSWLTPYVGNVSLDFLLRTGYMMVDGTILLSAFLLFLPYAKAMRHGSPLPEVRTFYQRRVARIFPSYYFLLAVAFFGMALPFRLYHSEPFMVKDLVSHLTFTFTFSYDTYVQTPLGAAPWTLAIELQAYIIFPFLARFVMKKPQIALPMMFAVAFGWRGYHLWALDNYNMVVNQLPSFMDVYAIGMMAAMAYVRLSDVEWTGRKRIILQVVATALIALCITGIVSLLYDQAASYGWNGIQWGQMVRRLPFTLLLCGVLLGLPFAIRPIRWLMGNRVMRFLSSISMNYYLIHQTLIVHMKRLGIPPSVSPMPNQVSERPWQYMYTFLSFGLSLLAATLVTLLVEKPGARWVNKCFANHEKRRKSSMKDPRMATLAHNLVTYSCDLKRGEKIWLEGVDAPSEFMALLVEEVYAAGGIPYVHLKHPRIDRALGMGATKEQLEWLAEGDTKRMSECQAYIGVRSGDNMYETGDIPAEKVALTAKYYATPVHMLTRVPNTKWVVLRWPTPSMAQSAGMSTEAFEDHFFNVCNLDYAKMSRAMDALVDRMNKAEQVHITGKGTDLTFSIRGMRAIKCAGDCNIPDGEVYTAPLAGTLEGIITYNTPSLYQGRTYENVCLRFEKGRIVEATANDTEHLNAILDTDPGARAVGEFAIGVNPYITSAIKDTLFDEKITGSFHLTPGRAYSDCDNGNRSAIHWDLVCIQTPEYGGGEMYFDGELIRKDGRFIPEDLQPLNPENLK